MSERMVGIGEQAIAHEPGSALVALALGSCIGLVLLDGVAGRAVGLAHVMLPNSAVAADPDTVPTRFADLAVPALADGLAAARVERAALEAVIVGGARMFSFELDVGPRNERAVRDALRRAGIPLRASDTGGTRGRTVRVDHDTTAVAVQTIGEETRELYRARARTMTRAGA